MVWAGSKTVKVLAGQATNCTNHTNSTNKNKQENPIVASKFEINAKLGTYKIISGHQNYMGVVSRLLIASPGHRPIETHYVL